MVEHSLWERDAAGSNPVTPIDYTYSNYGILLCGILARELGNSMDRVENGETIGVENENGDKAVMVPADDEIIRLYRDHEEGS